MLFKVLVGFLPCVFVLYVYCFKTWRMTKTYFPYGSANKIEFQLEIKASNLKFSHKSYFQDLFSLQAGLRKQLLPLRTLFQQNKIALLFFFPTNSILINFFSLIYWFFVSQLPSRLESFLFTPVTLVKQEVVVFASFISKHRCFEKMLIHWRQFWEEQ